jgi:hypothetical protein
MSLWLLIRNGNKYINIYPFPVIHLPVYHLLFLLWKIVKQVFYNNNLYILYNTDTFTMNKLMCVSNETLI